MSAINNKYSIYDLMICNLKDVDIVRDSQFEIQFIVCVSDTNVGYKTEGGQYGRVITEVITGLEIIRKQSNVPFSSSIDDKVNIFNSKPLEFSWFTEKELNSGLVTNKSLFKIYNEINFNKNKGPVR